MINTIIVLTISLLLVDAADQVAKHLSLLMETLPDTYQMSYECAKS